MEGYGVALVATSEERGDGIVVLACGSSGVEEEKVGGRAHFNAVAVNAETERILQLTERVGDRLVQARGNCLRLCFGILQFSVEVEVALRILRLFPFIFKLEQAASVLVRP